MIRFVTFATLFASAYCGLIAAPAAYAPAAAILNTGASSQYRSQDNVGNYAFGYNEDHSTGGTFRRESGDAFGTKVGSYGLRDADGRLRIVNYVADANGFRATISTNEPGTEPRDPASVLINKSPALIPAPAVAAPVVAAAAPVAAVAPVAAAAPLAYAPSYASPAYAEPAYAPAAFAPAIASPYTYGGYGYGYAPYGNFGLRK